MTLKEIADQLESCGYVCEAGKLEMNEAFIALRKYAQQEQSNEAADCATDVEEYEEMTIEEAIKHCEEVGRRSPCTPCEREHMRLAAWLTELVSLRAQHKQPVVVHGRWKPKRGNYITGGGNPLWCCSNCGYTVGASLLPPKSNYCPNCGAKMDGVCQEGDGHE